MKTNYTILLMLFISNFTTAQQAYFFATYRPKENGLSNDCQSAKEYILKEILTNVKLYY